MSDIEAVQLTGDELCHEIHENLMEHLNFLEGESQQSRIFNSLFKGSTLIGIAGGAFAAVTLPGWGTFALAGAAAGYIGTLASEGKTTGQILPFPFLGIGLGSIVRGIAKAPGVSEGDLIDYQYLDPKQKSDYALISMFAPEIAAALASLNTDRERKACWAKVSRRFYQLYSRNVVNGPDGIELKGDPHQIVAALMGATAVGPTKLPTTSDGPQLSPTVGPGIATQLNAVDVSAVEIEPDPWVESVPSANLPTDTMDVAQYAARVAVVEQPAPVASTLSLSPKTALAQIHQSPYKSRIFFGAQRSGKSMLVAIASRQLAERGTKVYHLNLLSYSKEGLDEDATYTRHCVRSIRGDISKLSEPDVIALVQDAIALVHEWWQQEDAILLVDEWAYLSAKDGQHAATLQHLLGLIAGKMAALTSSGMKRTLAVWAVAPKMVAGNMTDSGKAIKSMECVYVTVPPNRTVQWNGQGVGFDDQLFDQVSNNFSISYPGLSDGDGAERIAFAGDRWLPLGTTPDMLAQPLAIPKQLEIPSIPSVAVPSLFGDGGEHYPELEKQIANSNELQSAVFTWLKGLGNGAEVTTSAAAQSAWAKKAESAGKIGNRKAATLRPIFDKLTAAKFLKPVDNSTWTITLR